MLKVSSLFRKNKIIVIGCLLFGILLNGQAQEEIVPLKELTAEVDTANVANVETPDTVFVEAVDSVTQAVLQKADSLELPTPEEMKLVEPFKPDPNRALLYALVPGLGQIYNQKYWKLPILYGGLMGCMYAMTWNHGNYSDYSEAYWAVMQEDPLKYRDDWKNFVTGSIDWNDDEAMAAKAKDVNFQNQLKRRKDYFRRFRDLSIFIGVGVYVLSILDAYVDAQLFDFDISPDLSMRVQPAVTPGNKHVPHSYGINCSIKF